MKPEDLRNDEGSIDARMVRGGSPHIHNPVGRSTCRAWRERACEGETGEEIADATDRQSSVVTHHIRGDCRHTGHHPPLVCVDEIHGVWEAAPDPGRCDWCGDHLQTDREYCEDCYVTLERGDAATTQGD